VYQTNPIQLWLSSIVGYFVNLSNVTNLIKFENQIAKNFFRGFNANILEEGCYDAG